VSDDKSYILQHNAGLHHNMGLHRCIFTQFSLVHAVYIVCLSSTLQRRQTQTRNPGLKASKPETRVYGHLNPKPGCKGV